MNFKVILATVLALGPFMANASCFKTYQDKLVETENFIRNSNYERAQYEGYGLFTTSYGLIMTGLAGTGGMVASTVAGTGIIASFFLAHEYIDWRIEDGVEEAFTKASLLESSLRLLREAKVGQGPMLAEAIGGINRTVSSSISLKDLADKINKQNEERLYCRNPEQLMSPAGIFKNAINELKEEL